MVYELGFTTLIIINPIYNWQSSKLCVNYPWMVSESLICGLSMVIPSITEETKLIDPSEKPFDRKCWRRVINRRVLSQHLVLRKNDWCESYFYSSTMCGSAITTAGLTCFDYAGWWLFLLQFIHRQKWFKPYFNSCWLYIFCHGWSDGHGL